MSALNPNPLVNPGKSITAFGKIVSAVRRLLAPTTETPPLEYTFGTDAEARGYGNSPFGPETQSISSWAYDRMRLEAGRFAAYRDYELMDGEQPEISAALDVIAEFSTQSDDPKAETFKIESEDEELAAYLTQKAEELKLDELITPTAREIGKYGCSFWENVVDPTGQLSKVKPLVPTTMVRNFNKYGDLLPEAYTQMDPKTQQACAHFAAWQITQGRYQRMNNRPYGNSILESGRATFKKLQLMEDGLVVGRLYRSHMRYVFQIPVDGMDANRADAYLDKKKKEFRKRNRYNPSTQHLEGFDSPISADEDFFIGVRKEGVPGKVETVQGQGGLDQLADIEYFQNKLFALTTVPKALLGFERDVNAKATLTEQGLHFARTLRRMQQVAGGMVRQTLTIAMILDGLDPDKVAKWSVVMPAVSTTDELKQAQVEALRANIAVIYGQKLPIVDREFIYKKIMLLAQEEIERLEALNPSEFGIQETPSPPFENIGENEVELGNAAGGAGGGPPQGGGAAPTKPKTEAYLDLGVAADEAVVHTIREQLGLPLEDAITEGELHVARLLRDFHDLFGGGTIDEAAMESALTKSKEKHARNGHVRV